MQLSGSETSLPPDTSRQASLMSEASRTCTPRTSPASRSAISSPASGCGAMPFAAPDGQTSDLFGLVPVRANLSARQAKELGLLTSGTFGRPSIGSSESAALQESMESRLRARTQSLGSILFKMTWKAWITPSGRSRSRLRGSVLGTSVIGSTGWPTPRANDAEKRGVVADDPRNGLVTAANMTGWPTPTSALAAKGVRSMDGAIREAMRNHSPDLAAVSALAGWATPTTRDWRDGRTSEATMERNSRPLNEQAVAFAGSLAETESVGQLNPALPRWLMDLPEVWDRSAPYSSEWQSWQDLLQAATSAPEITDMAGCTDMETPSMPVRRASSSNQP